MNSFLFFRFLSIYSFSNAYNFINILFIAKAWMYIQLSIENDSLSMIGGNFILHIHSSHGSIDYLEWVE
jgi:hypothetical protein